MEEEYFDDFIEELCQFFIEDEEWTVDEFNFTRDPAYELTDSYRDEGEYKFWLEEKIDKAKTSEKKKELQKELDELEKAWKEKDEKVRAIEEKFNADLVKSGWKKQDDAMIESFKNVKSYLSAGYAGAWGNPQKQQFFKEEERHVRDLIAKMKDDKLSHVRGIYIDRNPEFIRDFCADNPKYSDICGRIPTLLPRIKKNMNGCLHDNEDAVADAIGYAEFMERERTRPL